MNQSFLYYTPAALLAVGLCLLTISSYWLGYYLKTRVIAKSKSEKNQSLGPVEGSLLGLLALLLSFTFSMSSARFDNRRAVIVEEANCIGTAVLRADLYHDSIKKVLKSDFKDYLEARIRYHQADTDTVKIKQALQDADRISLKIWETVSKAALNPSNVVQSNQMIPAVNAMIDIVNTRDEIKNATVPESILGLLFVLIFCSSFVVGYNNSSKTNHLFIASYAVAVSLTVFIILDLDRPRRGIINIKNELQKIEALRSLFQN